MNTDNIDRFGHCCKCHRNMIVKRVVDGKVIEMFAPEHDHTDFLLNNGSIMKVCMCKICKNSYDLNDPQVQSDIMEAVMKGWELETEKLIEDESKPDWTEERGKEYLSKMEKLNIDCHADNLTHSVVRSRSMELGQEFNTKILEEKPQCH